MEELGAQVVAPPIVIHQTLGQRFHDTHPMAKKRGPPLNSASFVHQNPSDYWNPKSWEWDSARFVAKPLQCDGGRVGSGSQIQPGLLMMEPQDSAPQPGKHYATGKIDENLLLKLGGGDGAGDSIDAGVVKVIEEPQPVSRPNKKVRSGSPGGANFPMCQVDNCKEDLSTAKDYHRRHKVCEVHSKASNAMVGKEMQRFCQQCSRFHHLFEFDEGKRSCRRRLAGHNRRRRKTQPDDTASRLFVPGSHDNSVSGLDIINLLTALTSAQGNSKSRSDKLSSIPDKDQLIQVLNKINSFPLPASLATKLNGSIPNPCSTEHQNQMNGNVSSPSTMDLLGVLLETPGAPSSDALENQSRSTEASNSEKSKSTCACPNLGREAMTECPSVRRESSSTSAHSPMEDVDFHAQETSPSLALQLFSTSPEDHSAEKLLPHGNYLTSESSSPSKERSLCAEPVVHDFFPMQNSVETGNDEHLSNSEGEIAYAKSTISNGCSTSLKLFGGSAEDTENGSIQSSTCQIGYTSSSGSDHSPPSLNSSVQDRTGRILFKLFDKDPSHLPGSLRTRMFNWLSNSPSEMESYIRPGCIILSLYLSMPSSAWHHLDANLLDYVKSLVKDIDVDFWGSGRFLVCTDRQMASHKDGKILLCKSWRAWNAPELISVSPVAVVGGQETSLLLRGRNLTGPGTEIHCSHVAGYTVREVQKWSFPDTACEEICLDNFKINAAASSVLGRCFIEAENRFRGSRVPVIIADSSICRELRLLEPEIDGAAEVCDGVPPDHVENTWRSRSKEEVLHFLDELGWLFQRKHNSCLFDSPDYMVDRFRFLLVFSVEHDFCALVRTLLDILLELNLGRNTLARKSLALLSELELLNRAVKRRCRPMVDLLTHYSVVDSSGTSEKFIFMPNLAGPGGVTPLHLAACTSSSDDLIDALTNDPLEVGLHSWNSVLDVNGLSPYAYAVMRNNHSYNLLVTRKLTDRKNDQVSVTIANEIGKFQVEADDGMKNISSLNQGQNSCSKCAMAARGYSKKLTGYQGLLRRPYIHSMLVIAAVCACVCVFLRGHPYVGGCVAPFAWENLDYGAM